MNLVVIQDDNGRLCKGTVQDYMDYVKAKGGYLTPLTDDEIAIYKYGFEMGKTSREKKE